MRFVVVFLCFLMLGCAKLGELLPPSNREIMDSWLGSHISEVIRSWGVYQSSVPDGKGGTIYIWDNSVVGQFPSSVSYHPLIPVATYKHGRTYTVEKRRLFFVRPDGIIYYWQTVGY